MRGACGVGPAAAPGRGLEQPQERRQVTVAKRVRPSDLNHDCGPGAIRQVALKKLRPAKLNGVIYKPLTVECPRVRELAEKIGRDGLLEPIVYTIDHVILSGHTRRLACQLAGLKQVPARQFPILSTDPRFPELLVMFNDQRVKTTDELFREALAGTDADDAYAELLNYRRERTDAATATAEEMSFGPARRRHGVSDEKRPFLDAILLIVEKLKLYWPLSNRQVHYQLLNEPPLRNTRSRIRYANDLRSYHDLNDILTRARFTGLIPWQAISDATRPSTIWSCHANTKTFIDKQVNDFMAGYNRDLLVSQPCYVELVCEKLTVVNVIRPIAAEYCVPYTVGRGYGSVDSRRKLFERFQRSGKDRLVLVVLSDHDPEGEDIARLTPRSMRDEFGVTDVVAVRAALSPEQVRELELSPKMTAKAKSSRRKGFVEQHGEHVYELEAVEPSELQSLLRTAIESVLDMDLFQQEQEYERRDAAELAAIRHRVRETLTGIDGL